jgi:hypothetical protein
MPGAAPSESGGGGGIMSALPFVGAGMDLLGGLFGGGEPQVPRTPYDQRPQRRNLLGLQNYLLGFSPSFTPYDRNTPGGTWGGQLGGSQHLPAYMGGAMQRGTPTSRFNGPQMNSQAGGGYGMQPGGGFSSQLGQGGASNPMLGRMESYFGPLGTPTTALQQQSLGGISQFLNSNPYGQSNNALGQVMGGQGYNEANQAFRDFGNQNYFGGAQNQFGKAGSAFGDVANANYFGGAQAGFNELANGNYFGNAEGAFNRLEGFNPFGAAQGSMEQILKTNPGLQGMEALQPLLQRNLAAANQEGGRFGSANAILRSRAVDDNNMLAAQMYQRGVDQQIGAAGQYGQMGNSLIGARTAAGQGLLGVGQGRMQQQTNAAQGMLGVGEGRLSQGLGAAQGQLGVGNGLLGIGQGRMQQGLGSAQGLGDLAMALQGDRVSAAGQMGTNANNYFNNLSGSYDVGSQQAQQEAERQQQALAILLSQLGVAEQGSLQGRG